MITSVDKFLVALIGSVIFFLQNVIGMNLIIPPDLINGLVMVLTPVIVYFMPNKGG